ncbi:MAG TPA: ATP-binding cassette domain-containing protein [Flavitalea sp.]|nr:ATP-binding cassette domain-containing protein [Flavitalea sp.]
MEVLKANEISVKLYGKNILSKISFTIHQGEQWAITGPSGSGKTTLLRALTGRQFFTGHLTIHGNDSAVGQNLVFVEQQHYFRNLSNTNYFYYQQRFNSHDAEDAITVKEYLHAALSNSSVSANDKKKWFELFNIKELLPKRLIQLSNGENKAIQVVKALLQQPTFLLLDNPFTGLDVKRRGEFETLLNEVSLSGVHIIMVVSASYMPFFITNVLSLSAGNGTTRSINPQQWNEMHRTALDAVSFDHNLLNELTVNNTEDKFEFAVKMKNVNIQYDRKILNNITWEVRKGERWSLSGPNGSGKSTLLSLVNADNPQAYANDIWLFDRKRGTGESIWDIKKQTGFMSPELHVYFEKSNTCFEIVASGLFDTIGLFRQTSDEQSGLVRKWMRLLKIEKLTTKFLHQLSNSEQRLVLLARALVKNPPLLILDEPCQGLDEDQVMLFINIINEICLSANKTLIYVSHYKAEVPPCVTKFICLENGKIIELKTSEN